MKTSEIDYPPCVFLAGLIVAFADGQIAMLARVARQLLGNMAVPAPRGYRHGTWR
jgi:hypothetical protein